MRLQFEQHHIYQYSEAAHQTANSEIYVAQDLTYNRNVVLKKVMVTGETPGQKAICYERIISEVKAMIAISELTTKIPTIYTTHYDRKESVVYIVMQWINGETLAQKLNRTVTDKQFLQWMKELCVILEAMEKKHFSHKDIKPDNIVFNKKGELYLIDFNLTISTPNQIEGTLHYKAPEMDSGSLDMGRAKVDMFSIGVMMYEKFTGTLPIKSRDYNINDSESKKWDFYREPKLYNKDINEEINRMIMKLMAYNSKDRYSSYKELIREIDKVERKIKYVRK